MALKVPYATISQANSYLSANDDWSDLDTLDKNTHLLNGRYFLDSAYSCFEEVDMADIPEEYVYANSLLAEFDLDSGLFAVSTNGNSPIVKKMVKAGEVESETTYAGSRSTTLKIDGIDLYPSVTSVLNEYCSRKKGSGLSSANLLRA